MVVGQEKLMKNRVCQRRWRDLAMRQAGGIYAWGRKLIFNLFGAIFGTYKLDRSKFWTRLLQLEGADWDLRSNYIMPYLPILLLYSLYAAKLYDAPSTPYRKVSWNQMCHVYPSLILVWIFVKNKFKEWTCAPEIWMAAVYWIQLVAHIIWFATHFFSDFTGLSEGQGIMSTK